MSFTIYKRCLQKGVTGSDVKRLPVRFIGLLVLFLLSFLAGFAYLLYLYVVFPGLVPFHGGGEGVTLTAANDYTAQIPWEAYARLHLTLQTNGTVKLHADGEYLGAWTRYEFLIEPGDYLLVRLTSSVPVAGRFTAWQETPFEKQLVGLSLLVVGLAGTGISTIALRKKC